MNSYNIDEIAIAQLIIVRERIQAGYKNIIGIPIFVNETCYFYSILDDCFFRGKIRKDKFRIEEELNEEEIYASIYNLDFGKKKIKRNLETMGIEKTTLTKEEIINGRYKLFSAHFSDLDYPELKTTTDVDYRDLDNIEQHLIINELQYEQQLDRPIMYEDGLGNVCNIKRLVK